MPLVLILTMLTARQELTGCSGALFLLPNLPTSRNWGAWE